MLMNAVKAFRLYDKTERYYLYTVSKICSFIPQVGHQPCGRHPRMADPKWCCNT